ncbi:response regulator receiver protein [Alkaliphilus metalliredigens QYMF]|uniref:Stage 0 sporulation protein A homolog n=1 Tax=Alkaliphilus metalliredigens (strain QYMF) TaxID=293826 RepID=A6TJW3_ALKMQ|nr:response regulator [Alkaliphilus metalliredigens]ABR46481.1 response regulator receiver protein [Alkaliphilus metalliredigens QYMF]
MKKNKVMIVDDSSFLRNIISDILQQSGFEIVGQAGSKEEALEVYDKTNPDIVTMDIAMPGADGFECVKALFEKNQDLKIIMISSMQDEELLTKAEKMKISGFIQKPFEEEDLISVVKGIMEAEENYEFLKSISTEAFKDAFNNGITRLTKKIPTAFREEEELNQYHSKGVTTLVGVIGVYSGRMIVDMSYDTADKIAAEMLRRQTKDKEEVLNTISEFANIICGNVCSNINKTKGLFGLRVAPPIIFYGEDLHSSTPNIHSKSLWVTTDFGEVWLNIGFKRSEGLIWK